MGRWSAWWRWRLGKNPKVKIITIEDEGPPIESSNAHDDERPWTGQVLREFSLPENEGGYLGAGIGAHSGPLALGPDEEVYNRKNPPLAPPTGSAEAAGIAWMYQNLGFLPDRSQQRFLGGLWGFTDPMASMEGLKRFAEERGVKWTSPAVQTQYMVEHFGAGGGMMVVPLSEGQTNWHAQASKAQAKSLHREFLLTIDHVENVIGDKAFAEKMREDLLDLWHQDKLDTDLVTAPEALGMTESEYSAWVEKKGE